MKKISTLSELRKTALGSLAVAVATVVAARASEFPPQLELALHGQANTCYRIEASTDLQHWTILATNRANATGALSFRDSQAAQFGRRYYRAVQLFENASGGSGQDYHPGKILVKPLPGANLAGLNLSLGVTVLHAFSAIGNLAVVKVPSNTTVASLVARYQQSGLVQYAEPDFYVQTLNTPNDFYYAQGNLWNLNNVGQNGGTAGADIHAPLAWDTITSASNVIVAVVDTGVRYTHEDLAANMWINPADGSHGTNTVAGNTNPNDDFGHGTHVSGTIGALGNNSVGIVGVCWHVQIMACKFLDSNGNGTISDAILCIDYARAHGAKIINASWGAPSFTSQALHDAIASARDADIIFVAAAGNSAADNDTTPLYPASYRDLDNVVAVAATDRNDQLASFSDYGSNSVDLAAPGTPIFSCYNGSDTDYQFDDGTSMACAHVSGACALLRAYFPNYSHRQVINQLLGATDPLPSLQGKTITGARLDLAKALNATNPPALSAHFAASPSSGQAPLPVQFTDESTGNPSAWSWNFGDGATSSTQSPSHTYSSAGTFTAALTVTGSGGQTSSTSQTITVTNASASVSASFTANPASGQAPLVVQFTDMSSGNPTGWSWNFGDGATSTTQSPSHTYSSAGTFTAALTVTGSGGQTSSTNQTITVTNAPASVSASFTANPTSGQAPLTVQFTDTSSGNPTSWSWNFGDGSTSTTQSPSHTYSSAGTFTAALTVTGSGSQTSSTSQTITVTNAPASVSASFTANPTSGQAPLAVQFTDHSTGPVTAWSWNFGDGSTSTTQSPSHTYSSAGTFTAALSVTGSGGQTSSTSQTITVTNAPTSVSASFTANPTSGQAPLAVQFTDQSSGPVTAWSWNFGDGSTSTTQNPSHTYSSAGAFTATLTVSGNAGQTSSTSQTITVTNAPASVSASFTANPTSGQAPLAVQFTDHSSGPIKTWSWDFGDGSTSSTQSPSHTYSAGTFTAALTVAGSGGQTSSTSQTITVTNAPAAVNASFTANPTSGQAPLAVQFTDHSSGPIKTWSWDFGDGSTSTTQNPSHTYNSAGTFTAALTVSGSAGQTSSTSQTITVTNAPAAVSASFTANPTSGQAPLAVQFTDQSSGPVTAWSWNFGDGSTSTTQSPSHTYNSAGTFTAALTVTGNAGQTSSTSHVITVTNPSPPTAVVTVAATQALATSLTPGVFTLTRTGATDTQLTVNYSLGGTAVNGVDYQSLSGSVVFPAGASTTTVVVQPQGLLTVLKTVVLTLTPGSGYSDGSPSTATVTILASL